MNLVDMARRSDRNLLLDADVVCRGGSSWESAKKVLSRIAGTYIHSSKRRVGDIVYRGFDLSVDNRTSVIIRSPFLWYPFRQRPELTGWQIIAADRKAEGAILRVLLKRRSDKSVLAYDTVSLSASFEAVRLPRLTVDAEDEKDCDLVLTFDSPRRGQAFLAVHRLLERTEIIKLCHGRGVEIGPGPNPQIAPAYDCDVTYVEQSPPDKWQALYDARGATRFDRDLWDRYTIGNAYPLPFEDCSLDFVFCSHVFEHLANPLGHLEHWRGKLRDRGVVVAIVPDVGGSKDYVFEPSRLEDILREYATGQMRPSLAHYQRWAAVRAPGKDPAELLKLGRSIHIHFYTKDNMSTLLEYAVAKLRFRWFDIQHTPNHKDFYFVISK